MPTRRNPVVRHGALLRKGGAHTESVSGKRHQSKRQLDDEIDEYFDNRENSRRRTKKERDDPASSSLMNFVSALYTNGISLTFASRVFASLIFTPLAFAPLATN